MLWDWRWIWRRRITVVDWLTQKKMCALLALPLVVLSIRWRGGQLHVVNTGASFEFFAEVWANILTAYCAVCVVTAAYFACLPLRGASVTWFLKSFFVVLNSGIVAGMALFVLAVCCDGASVAFDYLVAVGEIIFARAIARMILARRIRHTSSSLFLTPFGISNTDSNSN